MTKNNPSIKINDISEAELPPSITVSQIAKKLKISQPAVWKWFNGKTFPKGKHLLQLSKIMEKSPQEMIQWFEDERLINSKEFAEKE